MNKFLVTLGEFTKGKIVEALDEQQAAEKALAESLMTQRDLLFNVFVYKLDNPSVFYIEGNLKVVKK